MLLQIKNLQKSFEDGRGAVVRAVDGVAIDVETGETVGLVGESGCGKSTIARCVLGLVEPEGGEIIFDGVDLLGMRPSELRSLRSRIQMVFQDPRSLNPSFRVGRTVAEPLRLSGVRDRELVDEQVAATMQSVHLPASFASRRPGQLSGGQKQRVGIARAIITKPDLLVLDEPTSSLDQSVRAGIIALLRGLQEQVGMTYLFLSHDMATVRTLCDRVYIMRSGRIVEHGPTEAIYDDPRHAYTRTLIAAIPVADPSQRQAGWGRAGVVELSVDELGTLQLVDTDHYVAS